MFEENVKKMQRVLEAQVRYDSNGISGIQLIRDYLETSGDFEETSEEIERIENQLRQTKDECDVAGTLVSFLASLEFRLIAEAQLSKEAVPSNLVAYGLLKLGLWKWICQLEQES